MSFEEVADGPADAISSIRFSHEGSALLVGAWDSIVRLYTRQPDQPFALTDTFACEGPVLDLCWATDGSRFFTAGIDEVVAQYDVGTGARTVLSSHGKASNQVAYSHEHNVVISTSWDATMHVHELDTGRYIAVGLPAKSFGLSLTADRAVVAMAERIVFVYDLRALKALVEQAGETSSAQQPLSVEPWQQRESSLKFMTRDIACMPNGAGFAISSIEGRCGVEWFDPQQEKDTFAFKCHREKTETQDEAGQATEVDVIYPVNALAFHPIHGTFATGGGDGVVALWDPQTKRRIRIYGKQAASVAAVDFSADGKSLAVAISPGFEDGKEADEPDPSQIKILLRTLEDGETKAKQAKSKK